MATQETRRLCSLEAAIGKSKACPEDACPFWEPGGAALGGRCAFEELGVEPNAALASWLLEIRESLASASPHDADRVMRSVFHHLLNDSSE